MSGSTLSTFHILCNLISARIHEKLKILCKEIEDTMNQHVEISELRHMYLKEKAQ